MSDENAFLNQLGKRIDPDTLIVIGLGNPDRADDGAGIDIVKTLRARFPERVFLETEQGVEGLVLSCLENPSIKAVAFVDAVDFKGKSGQIKLFDSCDASRFIPAISTHKVPLTILMELIEKHQKNPFLIGIQPKSTVLFGDMSDEVKKAIQDLEYILTRFLS
jgi:hydrogenase maturation protease